MLGVIIPRLPWVVGMLVAMMLAAVGFAAAIPGHAVASTGSAQVFVMTKTNIEAFDAFSGHLNGAMAGAGPTSNAIAASPDGTRVYAINANGVTVIDPSTDHNGMQLSTGTGNGAAQGVAVSPDGHTVYAVTNANKLVSWDATTGTLSSTVVQLASGSASFHGVAATAGAVIAAGTVSEGGDPDERALTIPVGGSAVSHSEFLGINTAARKLIAVASPDSAHVFVTDGSGSVAMLNGGSGLFEQGLIMNNPTGLATFGPFLYGAGCIEKIEPGVSLTSGTACGVAVAISPDGGTAFVPTAIGGFLLQSVDAGSLATLNDHFATLDDAGVGVVTAGGESTGSSISVADVSVNEPSNGSTPASFLVTLDNASTKTITVDYATEDGTATSAHNDYAATSGTLTFAPGETTKTVTVTVNASGLTSSSTFHLVLSNPSNATIARGTATATIEAAGGVSIAAGPPVPEPASGSVPATFTITLPSAQLSDTTVNYRTADGTATAAANEYTAVSSGSLVIPAGHTSGQIQIQVGNGSGVADSGTETFQVTLTSATNSLTVDPTGGTATGQILVPQIFGTVTSKNGDPMANAAIALNGAAASGQTVSRHLQSDGSGKYSLFVDPGSYVLTANAPAGVPGLLFAAQCPGGSVVAGGCRLQLPPGAKDTIDFNQGPISITAIKFRQRSVATDAMEAVPASGTIDGNLVDVIATLHNNTNTDRQTDVSFGSPIDDSASSGISRPAVSVPAAGSVEVDEVLDTNGLAWSDTTAPFAQRTIKISLSDGTEASTTLTVRPKPVILVHGLFSDASTWHAYVGGGGFLGGVNLLWRGYAVGDGQAPGVMDTSPFASPGNTIAQNAFQEAIYIRSVRETTDAARVDIVAHSLGGLISRYYLQELMPDPLPGDTRPVVAHLVMMGTPNQGSHCAYEALALEELFGKGTITAMNQPLIQLTPASATIFNAQITDRKGIPFSILAGTGFHNVAACTNPGGLSGTGPGLANDGLVTVPSAWWTISDRTTQPLIHTSETSSPTAFEQWVLPHLAIGPGSTGGGRYRGPLVAGATDARGLTDGRSAAGSVTARASVGGTGKAKVAKVCLVATGAPSLAAGEIATVHGGGRVTMAIHVPAHSGRLGVLVLAQPTVTSVLRDPHGRVAQTILAGSATSGGLFRTLDISAPRAGTWHLDLSAAVGAPAGPVSVAVQYAHNPLAVTVRLSHTSGKPRGSSRAAALRFTARVEYRNRPVPAATVTLALLVAGKRAIVLRLKPINRRHGSYAATTGIPAALPTLVLIRAAAYRSVATASLQLTPSCGKGK